MDISLFDYDLPEHFIAQHPIEPRDASKLLHLERTSGRMTHRIFRDILDLLHAGDVLVLNNTRVIPARLLGVKEDTQGSAELLLLRQINDTDWLALVGGKGLSLGRVVLFPNSSVRAKILEERDGAQRIVRFNQPIDDILDQLGQMPLPPYIRSTLTDPTRYQTVYHQQSGSAAAPTAGLHFTPELLIALRDKGIKIAYCTLHIGLDTFQPVKVTNITEHQIHSEWAELDDYNAKLINSAKLAGKRIIAVGTTSARTLETAAILSAGGDPSDPYREENTCAWRPVTAFAANTRLFIYPSYRWRVVDALITNFHLPKSTLLMMISAFAGRETVLAAYEEAKVHAYRFFSFGDAMFIE